jgi:protein TonB
MEIDMRIRGNKPLTAAIAAGLFCTASLIAEDIVHVSQSDALKNAKQRVEPEYPAMAKQLHLEGSVQVEAHIGENGEVEDVKPLTGNAVLMNSAVAALKKWRFAPFTADGKPVKAIADLSFKFKL